MRQTSRLLNLCCTGGETEAQGGMDLLQVTQPERSVLDMGTGDRDRVGKINTVSSGAAWVPAPQLH